MQWPSRAQLNQMLGKVDAKINVIDQMIDFNNSNFKLKLRSYQQKFNSIFETKRTEIQNKVGAYLQAQLECMANTDVQKCDHFYHNATKALLNASSEEAYAKADRDEFLENAVNSDSYIKYLKGQRDKLSVQQSKLHAMLGETDPFMDGILEADQLAIANLSDTYKDDNWLQFSFDSAEGYENTYHSSFSESNSAAGGIHFFHIGGSYTHSKQTSQLNFNQQLASSQMKAKGKLLRVNIKRPWFKPEVFEDPQLELNVINNNACISNA